MDTFFVRSGDVLSALMVFLCANRLGWPAHYFSIINIVLAVIWMVIAIGIVRQHARLSKEQGEKEREEGGEEEAERRPASKLAASA